MRGRLLVCSALILAGCLAHAAPPPGVAHVVERDGLKLALWERRPARLTKGDGTKIVLLLHGATWSGRPDFDLQIRDYSLMEALARAGYDAFALDIHGYGASPPSADPADYSTAADAVKDVDAAVAYIAGLRHTEDLNLFGWSWGAHVAGLYASQHPQRIVRLVLYGFFPGTARPGPEKLPPERFRKNAYPATQGDFIEGEFEPDVAAFFGREALAACPQTPLGVAVDFGYRMPLFQPGQLAMPTMLIYGVYDLQPPQKRQRLGPEEFARIEGRCLDFFGQLGTRDRAYVVVPGGGHGVHLERGHQLFQRALVQFLDAGRPPSLPPASPPPEQAPAPAP